MPFRCGWALPAHGGILSPVKILSGHVPSLLGNAALGSSTAFVVAMGQLGASGLITCLRCVTWLCRFGSGWGRTEWRGRLRVILKQIIETDWVVSVVRGFQGGSGSLGFAEVGHPVSGLMFRAQMVQGKQATAPWDDQSMKAWCVREISSGSLPIRRD